MDRASAIKAGSDKLGRSSGSSPLSNRGGRGAEPSGGGADPFGSDGDDEDDDASGLFIGRGGASAEPFGAMEADDAEDGLADLPPSPRTRGRSTSVTSADPEPPSPAPAPAAPVVLRASLRQSLTQAPVLDLRTWLRDIGLEGRTVAIGRELQIPPDGEPCEPALADLSDSGIDAAGLSAGLRLFERKRLVNAANQCRSGQAPGAAFPPASSKQTIPHTLNQAKLVEYEGLLTAAGLAWGDLSWVTADDLEEAGMKEFHAKRLVRTIKNKVKFRAVEVSEEGVPPIGAAADAVAPSSPAPAPQPQPQPQPEPEPEPQPQPQPEAEAEAEAEADDDGDESKPLLTDGNGAASAAGISEGLPPPPARSWWQCCVHVPPAMVPSPDSVDVEAQMAD